ncbi:MAG: orotate phosphoribosyltransferase [Acidilobus sp.]
MPGPEQIVLKALRDTGALLFGEFRLSSGAVSHVYVDMRRVLGSPPHFRELSALLAREVLDIGVPDDAVVAGVATGGIPWATAVAMILGYPLAYVRQPKGHGTERVVEGADVSNRNVVIIDDVATTGGSLAASAKALRSLGASSVKAVVIVDREQGASAALAQVGVELRSVVTLRRLLEEALSWGLITREQLSSISRELWGSQP